MRLTPSPTPRQQAVLDFIRGYQGAYGRPPTVREIGAHFGIASPNGVVCHLRALLRKRLIEHSPLTARSLRVVTGQNLAPEPVVVRVGDRVMLGIGSAVTGLTRQQAVTLAGELLREARGLPREATGGGQP